MMRADGSRFVGTARAAALAMLVMLLAAAPAQARTGSAAARSCPDVMMIGARGSGENDTKQLKSTKDLGYEVHAIGLALQSKLTADDESMKMKGIPYDAVSVKVLELTTAEKALLATGQIPTFLATYESTNVRTFTNSIEQGAQEILDQADSWASACPDTDLVLSGYSQGAIAVHRALIRIEDENNLAAGDAILGAIVLADGDRVPSTKAKHFGSAKGDASGIRTYLHHDDNRDFPDPETVVDICDRRDIVCDFNVSNAKGYAKTSAVHTQYLKRDGGKLLRRAANWFYREMLGG